MSQAHVVPATRRRTYLVDLPVNAPGADLAEAFECASPKTWESALRQQAAWYSDAAVAMRMLAMLARRYDLAVEAAGHTVRVTGPQEVLGVLDFLRLDDEEDDDADPAG